MTGEPYIAVAAILFLIVIAMLEIAFKLAQEHYPLKLFFIWLSVIFTVPIAQTAVRIGSAEAMDAGIQNLLSTIQYSITIISIVSTAYFMLFILKNMLQAMPVKNKLRNPI
jgi:hypothetical protein